MFLASVVILHYWYCAAKLVIKAMTTGSNEGIELAKRSVVQAITGTLHMLVIAWISRQ